MSDEVDEGPGGWGAPCEARPETMVSLRYRAMTFKVKAYTFGAWAVHRAIAIDGFDARPDPDSWGVSHVPLDDTQHFTDANLDEDDGLWVFEAAIGAALHDHYVWPLYITEAA